MKRAVKIIAVVVVAAGIAAYFIVKKKKPAGSEDRIVTATKDSIAVNIQATGVVQPQNRVEIKPTIAGRAEDILVNEGDTVRKGQIIAWMSSSERASLIDSARAKGPEELKHWEDLYKPAPLVAPLSGVVIARDVEPGQTLTSADPVIVMSNRLIVKAQVDETDIGQIRIGQAAMVTLDAYPDSVFQAKVDHIAFEAKTVSNVTIYEVEVAPNQVPDFMRSGMTANVLFSVSKKEGVIVIPSEAVQSNTDGTFVRIPGEKDHPQKRPIKTGITDGKMTEVESGLSEGDSVLIRAVRLGEKKVGGNNPFSPFGNRPRPGAAAGSTGSAAGGRPRQ